MNSVNHAILFSRIDSVVRSHQVYANASLVCQVVAFFHIKIYSYSYLSLGALRIAKLRRDKSLCYLSFKLSWFACNFILMPIYGLHEARRRRGLVVVVEVLLCIARCRPRSISTSQKWENEKPNFTVKHVHKIEYFTKRDGNLFNSYKKNKSNQIKFKLAPQSLRVRAPTPNFCTRCHKQLV